MYTNNTCQTQSSQHVKGEWFRDSWGETNQNAGESDEKCEMRRNSYNNWCGTTDFIYKFNPKN